MPLYLHTDTGDQLPLATTTGWSLVGKWVDSLDADEYPLPVQLWEHGTAEPVSALLDQLTSASAATPPDGEAAKTVGELADTLSGLDGESAVVVSDGMGEDDGTEDVGESITDAEYATLSEAGRAGLVQKDVQYKKNGKTYTRKQWVRAEPVKKAEPKPKKEPKPKPEPKRAQTAKAQAAAQKELATLLKKPTHDTLPKIREHLGTLSGEQLKALLVERGLAKSGAKKQQAERLVAAVEKSFAAKTKAEPKSEKPAKAKPEPKAKAEPEPKAAEQPKPRAARPAWAKDRHLATVLDTFEATTGDEQRYMRVALQSVVNKDGTYAPDLTTAANGDDDPVQARFGLAGSLVRQARAAAAKGVPHANILRAASNLGAEPHAEVGASVPFNGAMYAHLPGLFTGHKVKVVSPAWVADDGDGQRVLVKGEVERV